MKVLQSVLARAALVAFFAAIAAATLLAPASAGAITRSQVIDRASSWVAKRVPYSQNGSFQGYRRDCSGFVSMAWKLDSSYTTRSISSVAKRVAISDLKPGDAVLTPGHVTIFGGWKNRSQRTYIALEETTWGSHAKKRVRSIGGNAKGLRLRDIKDKVAAPPSPAADRVAEIKKRSVIVAEIKSRDHAPTWQPVILRRTAADERVSL